LRVDSQIDQQDPADPDGVDRDEQGQTPALFRQATATESAEER